MDLLKKHFSHDEIEALRGYVHNIKAWNAERPEQLTEAEEKYIIEYAKQHNGEIPAEYKNRVELQYKIEDQDSGADLGGTTTKPVIIDVVYNAWINKIHTITDIRTIYKCVDLINEERTRKGEYKLLFAPQYEDDYIEITEAIINLLGEDNSEENIKNLSGALIVYSQNTALPIFTGEKSKNYTKQLIQSRQNTLEWNIDGTLDIKADEKQQLILNALENKYPSGDINRELLEALCAGMLKYYEKEDAPPTLYINRMNLSNYLGISIRKPTEEILSILQTGNTDKDIQELTQIKKAYSFWYDLINLSRSTGFLTTEKGIYKAFIFKGYNIESDLIACESPFIYEGYRETRNNKILSRTRHNNQFDYEIEPIALLLRGSFAKIRSEATKEVIRHLIYGIVTRGLTPDVKTYKNPNLKDRNDNKVSYFITYKSLIENCDSLYNRLYPIDENGKPKTIRAQNKITILNRAIVGNDYTFTKDGNIKGSIIETCFKNETVVFEKYANFNIEINPISLKSLDKDGIKITHQGLNADYIKSPEALRAPEIKEINT